MKRLVSMMVITIAMMTFSVNTFAQSTDKKQRKSREELAEAQAKHIARELGLDDATTQKYVTTSQACQKEVWALGPKAKPKKHAELTEAESEQAIKERFEHSEKILKIREKYYKEYSKFMTQKQIQRAYELEKKGMNRLTKHQKNSPKKKGAGPKKGDRRRLHQSRQSLML